MNIFNDEDEFKEIFEEEINEDDSSSLTSELDKEILMHRDAHFGGKFDFMIDYYEKGGKGVRPEFELEYIRTLDATEKKLQQNLASVLLSGGEAEKIARAKDSYKKLRDLYERENESRDKSATVNPRHHFPILLADLILSEEEYPKAEIDAIVAEKSAIVPFLIDLLRAENFHDPLFPGYGTAPMLAATCLGIIGDKKAIIALFEGIGSGDFFDDDIVLNALKAIGESAKQFLLHVLRARPITYDNERAAMALTYFSTDPEVATSCFKMLKEIDLKKQEFFATLLVLGCEGLLDKSQQLEFRELAEKETTPKGLRRDMKLLSSKW